MGYALRSGVTCCRTGGFTFFLDTKRDRYFAICGEADAAFVRLIDGCAQSSDTAFVAQLVRDGLLEAAAPGVRPSLCRFPHRTIHSAIDLAELERLKPSALIERTRIVLAKSSIRHLGLGRTLARLARRKHRSQTSGASIDTLPRLAAAFERCNIFASPLDQCLPRSVAVAHRMLDLGLAPTFIMGVRAEPFGAHAWVESGTILVNDRFDTVEPYEPILVL